MEIKSPLPFFFKILFIYLPERVSDRAQAGRAGAEHADGEAGSPFSKNPDAGLDPRILES